MKRNNGLPIREFSRLTGIKSENLRFYDQIGLLTPETRGDNNYRYYSRRQLNSAYLITALRDLGVGLEEIRQYSAERTPQKMLELFAWQEERIKAEMERLREMRGIMALYSAAARDALSRDEEDLTLEERERQPLFLCPVLDAEAGSNDEGGILSYEYANDHGINIGYPFGVMISRQNFEEGNAAPVMRYFFKVRRNHNGWKPAGLYAVAYGRSDPWQTDGVYRRLRDFLRENRLKPCGDAYEEYPLDELAVQDNEKHCVRVEIPVERKEIKRK